MGPFCLALDRRALRTLKLRGILVSLITLAAQHLIMGSAISSSTLPSWSVFTLALYLWIVEALCALTRTLPIVEHLSILDKMANEDPVASRNELRDTFYDPGWRRPPGQLQTNTASLA